MCYNIIRMTGSQEPKERKIGLMREDQLLECGIIVNTHGVKGACKIESWCDSPEVLCGIGTLYYKKKDEFVPLTVKQASVHKNHALVYFEGVDSIEDAQLLKNRVVYADRDEIPLDEDRVFIADMIGLPVFDQNTGKKLGVLEDVIESPGSDLLSVRTDGGREVLVPAVNAFLDHIMTEGDGKGVWLTPIPGFFDEDAEVIPKEADDEI